MQSGSCGSYRGPVRRLIERASLAIRKAENMMSIRLLKSGLVLVAVASSVTALNACSSSTKSPSGTPEGGSSGGAAKGGSGGTGTGGAGGSRGGAGGTRPTGDASTPTGNKSCGPSACVGAPIAALNVAVNACCPDGDTKPACGLDLSLLSAAGVTVTPPCQAKRQPGDPSAECPDAIVKTSVAGNFTFKGCCRPDHQCGGLVNSIDVTTPIMLSLAADLGCVSAAALGDAGSPKSCTPTASKDATAD
jgi:hypothetical protein